METLPEFFEPAERYSLPNPPHAVKVKAQVMQRVKGGSGHFAGLIKMPQIGPRKVAACITAARRIDRTVVFRILGVLDVDRSFAGKQLSVPRVARGHDAVEHVDSARHAFDEVNGRAD